MQLPTIAKIDKILDMLAYPDDYDLDDKKLDKIQKEIDSYDVDTIDNQVYSRLLLAQALLHYQNGQDQEALDFANSAINNGLDYKIAYDLVNNLNTGSPEKTPHSNINNNEILADSFDLSHLNNNGFNNVEEIEDIARNNFIHNWPPLVRWLLFIPAALVIPIIVSFAFDFGTNFAVNRFLDPGAFNYDFAMWVRQCTKAVMVFGAFVFVGAFFAPKHQLVVGLAFLIITIVIVSMILTVGLMSQTGLVDLFAFFISALVGSGFALYTINNMLAENKKSN